MDDSENNSILSQYSKAQLSLIKVIKKNTDATQSSSLHYDYLFKISLIGDSGSGKTSILMRFIDHIFKEDTSSTIGVDFKIVSFDLGNDTYAKMQIWDTCGSERFKSITSSFIKSCPAFLLVFDLSKRKTFHDLDNWIKLINENTSPRLLCLVGNKCDLEDQRQVSREEAVIYSEKHGLKYIETSAKSNNNIEAVFLHVAQMLYDEVKKKKIDSNGSKISGFEIGGYKAIKENVDTVKEEKRMCAC